MKGKIYRLGSKYVAFIEDSQKYYFVRPEDSRLPYVIGSDIEFTLDKLDMAIINKCETIAEIHNISLGWICPKCNMTNAPFIKNCDC